MESALSYRKQELEGKFGHFLIAPPLRAVLARARQLTAQHMQTQCSAVQVQVRMQPRMLSQGLI